MAEFTPLPPPETLNDREIQHALNEHGNQDERRLWKVFAGPLNDVAERISHLIIEQPEAVAQLAEYRPVFSMPAVALYPDMNPADFPDDVSDVDSYLDEYWPTKLKHDVDPTSRVDIPINVEYERAWAAAELSRLATGQATIRESDWDKYQDAHQRMHQMGKCDMRALVYNRLFGRHNVESNIHNVDKYFFENQMTYQYDGTSMLFGGGWYPSQAPVYEGNPYDGERWAQAVGLVGELMWYEPRFLAEGQRVAAEYGQLLGERTLRGQDKRWKPEEVLRITADESYKRGVSPMLIEGTRLTPDSTVRGDILARVGYDTIPVRLTQQAPLGYAGPVNVYSIGLRSPVTMWSDTKERLALTPEAYSDLQDMRSRMNRFVHYPELRQWVQSHVDGEPTPPPTRTGIGCPVRLNGGELLSPITSASEVLYLAYDLLGKHPVQEDRMPVFNLDNPYTMREPRPEVLQLLEDNDRLLASIPSGTYSSLGRQAMRRALDM